MAEHARDPGKRPAQRRARGGDDARIHGADDGAERGRGEPAPLRRDRPRAPPARTCSRCSRGELPVDAGSRAASSSGLPVLDALVRAGLATSKGDARRGIQGKGFS